MTPRRIQWIIAAVFLGLGGWCVIAPMSVVELTLRPSYQTNAPILPIMIACFGAQAMLVGLLAAFADFNRRAFMALGLAMLPFLWFDYHFYFVEPVFNELILLDVIGNLALMALAFWGYRLLSRIGS